MKMMPDGRYDLKSFATDAAQQRHRLRRFKATHTRRGRPAATGKSTSSDYVY